MKWIYVALTFLTFSVELKAQQPDAVLQQKLRGKTKVSEIYEEAEKHLVAETERLRTVDPGKAKTAERQRKKWARWNAYWEPRQNPDGTPANVQKRYATATNSASFSQRTLQADPSSGQWTLVGPGNTDDGSVGRVSRIAFHPTSASTIYIGTPNAGIWRTTNTGISWQALSSYAPTLGVSGIVVSHANANTIYALTGDGDSFYGGDLFGTDGGFQQEYGYTERSIGVLRSNDGGTSWYRTGAFGTLTDDDVYFGYRLVQHPTNAQMLMAATSHGIYRTLDGGNSWIRCPLNGVASNSRVIFDIEFMPGNPNIVYASSTGSGFFRSTDAGLTFQLVTGSDLSLLTGASRMELAVSPANPQVVYIFAGPGRLENDNNSNDTFLGMFRSTDGGQTFTRRANSPDLLGFDGFCCTFEHQSRYDMALALKPTNSNVVITGGLVMWKSTDGGVTYNEETDYFPDLNNSDYIHPDIHDIAYSPHNANLLYAATDGGIWVSNDDAYSWASLNNGLSITQFYKMEAVN
ncbi:MAG TPA: hypothetical protein VMR70_04050, partial [Flavisolibacter sp.]|nr:hypothetical protein [Flavisolibacter sp.]